MTQVNKNIPIIDSHQHFWHYTPETHGWIDDDMAVIRKDFLPADLLPELQANGVRSCIAVQADQTALETKFLTKLAFENDFIDGVVGWTDLRSVDVQDKLLEYKENRIVKGFRHILQGEAPEFMMQTDFLNGISLLAQMDFTYDILVFPHHLPMVAQFVKKFPDQRFVIDHLAKPYIKAGEIEAWKKDITCLAGFSNVYCKISGMVTEADPKNWKDSDFHPYIDAVVESFGTDRIMFGTDWPVCLVGGTYSEVINITKDYFSLFSETEQSAFFSGNAKKFYKL